MTNNHYHRCSTCNTEWGHPLPPPDGTEAAYQAAHRCPACGRDQRRVERFENRQAECDFAVRRGVPSRIARIICGIR